MVFAMMNVTKLGVVLAVSVCAIPIWAMNRVDYTRADQDAWKAAWCRSVNQLPPAATPFPDVEATLTPVTLKMPHWGGVSVESLGVPLYAETPFLGLGELPVQTLLTER